MVLALFRPKVASNRPQAVVALTDSACATELAAHLKAGGWQVTLADTPGAARKLSARLRAEVVILTVDRAEETGYLTCAKLQRCRHRPKVLLVADEVTPGRDAFAAYVGAMDVVAAGIGPRAIAARVQSAAPAIV